MSVELRERTMHKAKSGIRTSIRVFRCHHARNFSRNRRHLSTTRVANPDPSTGNKDSPSVKHVVGSFPMKQSKADHHVGGCSWIDLHENGGVDHPCAQHVPPTMRNHGAMRFPVFVPFVRVSDIAMTAKNEPVLIG